MKLAFLYLLTLSFISNLFIPCAFSDEEKTTSQDKPSLEIKKIAFMPFSSELRGFGETISASAKEQFLTEVMYSDLIAKVKGIEFVSPESSDAELSRVKEDNPLLLDKSAILEAGKNLGADAVLLGYISEYKEREGGDLGISAAASVAFGVQLLNTANGQILWEDYYSETQRPLSENLLEVRKFFRRGAKWITADELAKEGVAEVVDGLNTFLVKYPATTGRN